MTVGIVQARQMMTASNLLGRIELQKECAKFLMNEVKEDFYAKQIEEMMEIQDRQKETFRANKDPSVIDRSVANFY